MFVQIENLKFQYKNAKKLAIDTFSLNIQQGEIISILGKSGSGKSTLLRLIAGLEVPTNGSILINGKVMCDHNQFIQPEKRGVGMVFQDYALFPHMTVIENIKFGLKKLTKVQKNERIIELLQLMGLNEYGNRYPYELSGGQQQRVALARAMAQNPTLIMFDEPFSNLDADLQIQIREDLRSIIHYTGMTSIFVTHDQEDAKALADRIVVMEEGKITKVGSTTEIFGKAETLKYVLSP